MNPRLLLGAALALVPVAAPRGQATPAPTPLLAVERIWDRAEHCAFTDLVVVGERRYVSFREGTRHVFGSPGLIRVLGNAGDGEWRSVARIAEDGSDLRDPKLELLPDGRLMLNVGASRYVGNELRGHSPRVAFGDAATGRFGALVPVTLPASIVTGADWLWRVTWHGETGYGVVYHPRSESGALHLVRSTDGLVYELLATLALPLGGDLPSAPNEASLAFLSDETMVAVVRCDGPTVGSFVGYAKPPYERFEWQVIGRRLGGPDVIVLEDDRVIVGTRGFPTTPVAGPGRVDDGRSTVLFEVAREGAVSDLVTLPSGGDTGYPGLALDGDELLVAYYTSHRGTAAIHLARVRAR
ncbi:MAG: hypothetical protein IT457_02220 [Planctomycetes bacterium]|nr:hypothetical protein [Planctomycetota bacterium]